ncbi:hypothetical protein D3C72_2128420 [compost metagenome]
MKHDGAPDCRDAISDAVDRQRRDRDQSADETAARLVMAAQQHEDGKQHHEAGDDRSDGAQNERVHARAPFFFAVLAGPLSAAAGRMRISARMARPVIITTAISPSVSVPRKSTMMTLTTLAPWAMTLE